MGDGLGIRMYLGEGDFGTHSAVGIWRRGCSHRADAGLSSGPGLIARPPYPSEL